MPCGGELRSTLIMLERGGRTTVLNEPGPRVDERRVGGLRARGARAPDGALGVLVCSGSVPPGSPPDAYGRLVALARARGRASVVDAAGETLLRALDAAPDLVTPNLAEAEGALGPAAAASRCESRRGRPAARAGRGRGAACAQGARAAVVTADAAGAAVARGGGGGVDRRAARRRGAQPDRRGRRVLAALAWRGRPLEPGARALERAAPRASSPPRGRCPRGRRRGSAGGVAPRPPARGDGPGCRAERGRPRGEAPNAAAKPTPPWPASC